MAKVSIIVPIYNAEKCIRRCIESIINQEYVDFELILCDDGSKDSSGAICDEYAAKDSRIKVLHKENSGVSNTRNQGIREACGTYIQFLDADDWITVDATKLLVRAMEENDCDMVVSDFYRVIGERVSQKGDIDEEGVISREKFAKHMMENPADFYYGVLWNKLYKREIIEEYEIQMDENVSWCEDFLFNMEYLLHTEKIAVLPVPIYYYVKTEGSLVSQGMSISKMIKMKISVFEYYNDFYKHVYEEEDYEKRRLGVYRFLVDTATDGFVAPSFLPGTKKLGRERSVTYENMPNNIFSVHYHQRKLLEQYLETIALKYDLELRDVMVMTYVANVERAVTYKEIADYTGYSKVAIARILQKLVMKHILDFSLEKKEMEIVFLEEYSFLKNELEFVKKDYDNVRFQGFTEEEKETFLNLMERIYENIRKVLVTKE